MCVYFTQCPVHLFSVQESFDLARTLFSADTSVALNDLKFNPPFRLFDAYIRNAEVEFWKQR